MRFGAIFDQKRLPNQNIFHIYFVLNRSVLVSDRHFHLCQDFVHHISSHKRLLRQFGLFAQATTIPFEYTQISPL